MMKLETTVTEISKNYIKWCDREKGFYLQSVVSENMRNSLGSICFHFYEALRGKQKSSGFKATFFARVNVGSFN